MKKIAFLIFAVVAMTATATAQKSYTVEGLNYKTADVKKVSAKQDTTVTAYTYEVKGVQYPIVISKSGSCFIGRTSAKSGKYYRQYLGEEISRDVCSKMGREYTARKKGGNND